MILRIDFLKSLSWRIDVKYTLLALAILAIPFNLKIIGPLRLLDILLLMLIVLGARDFKLKLNTFHTYMILGAIGIFSTFIGVFEYGLMSIQTIFFAYKFLMPLLILKTLENLVLSDIQIRKLLRYQFWVYLFLVFWVFIYIYLVFSGLMAGNPRPSLPFVEKVSESDSPYYSTILWMYFILIFIIYKYLRNWILRIGFLTLGVTSALLTGGRSGLVLLVVFFLIYWLYSFRPYVKAKLLPLYIGGFFGFIALSVFFAGAILESDLIARAFNFSIAEDASALGRINKLRASFFYNKDVFFLVGRGLISHDIIWYDGAFSTVNAYFGLIGALVVFVLLINFFIGKIYPYKTTEPKLFITLLAFTLSYIFTNLISDYYLLTRSIFPFVLNFVLIQRIYFLGKSQSVASPGVTVQK